MTQLYVPRKCGCCGEMTTAYDMDEMYCCGACRAAVSARKQTGATIAELVRVLLEIEDWNYSGAKMPQRLIDQIDAALRKAGARP